MNNKIIFFATGLLLISTALLYAETRQKSENKPANETESVQITGENLRLENNTIMMEDLVIYTPPMIYRYIMPKGDEKDPGFGTVYRSSRKRTISGRITIEPLP